MKVFELLPKISPDVYVNIVDERGETIEKGYTDLENFTSAQTREVERIDIYDEYQLNIKVKAETEEERLRRMTRENYERQFGKDWH